MNTTAYFTSLQQAVLQARAFGQAECEKRKQRMEVAKPPAVQEEPHSLNDYIEAFQITSSGELYSGENFILDDFERAWHDVVQAMALHEQRGNIEMAVTIMQEDVQQFIHGLRTLHVEDAAFHDRVKEQIIAFIQHVLVAIRDGWATSPRIYEQLLQPLQQLLSDLGVYTLPVAVGDALNYDIVEPQQATTNVTEDAALIDTIKEVQLYPYVYGNDEAPFIVGHAIAWRKG